MDIKLTMVMINGNKVLEIFKIDQPLALIAVISIIEVIYIKN